jgi:hypothetical protein
LNWIQSKDEKNLERLMKDMRDLATTTINKRIDLIKTGQRDPTKNPDFLDLYLVEFLKDLNLPLDKQTHHPSIDFD